MRPIFAAILRRRPRPQSGSIDMPAFEAEQLQQRARRSIERRRRGHPLRWPRRGDGGADRPSSVVGGTAERRSSPSASSGLTYALIHEWRRRRLLDRADTFPAAVAAAKPDRRSQRQLFAGDRRHRSSGPRPRLRRQLRSILLHFGSDHPELRLEQYLRQAARRAVYATDSVVLYTALGERSARDARRDSWARAWDIFSAN